MCLNESQVEGIFLDLIGGSYWKLHKIRQELHAFYCLLTEMISNKWWRIRFSCSVIVNHFNAVVVYYRAGLA
jgi:hypothetical protein